MQKEGGGGKEGVRGEGEGGGKGKNFWTTWTRTPDPKSKLESGSQSTWERWPESGFESRIPSCERSQSGSGPESPCKQGARFI